MASFTPEMEAIIPDTIWSDFFATPDLTKERLIVIKMIQHMSESDRLLFANLEAPQAVLAEMLGIHVSNVCRRLQDLQRKLIAIKDVDTTVTDKQWDQHLQSLSKENSNLLNNYAKTLSKRETARLCGWSVTNAHNTINELISDLSPDIGQLLEYCLEHRVPLRACLLEESCQHTQEADQLPIEKSIASE